MRIFRWALFAILASIFGIAIYQSMLWLGVLGNPGESYVLALEEGEQEIALIEPATSTDEWGRLITAVKLIEHDWPKLNPTLPALRLALHKDFPTLTTDVPEIAIWLDSAPQQKLRLRWYKISGEHDAASWIEKLNARARPPLAIIGGGTSDRAVRMARALQRTYPDPARASPVFLMTTATAEKTAEETLLIDEYPRRTFRYAFTNQKMVEALLQFVKQTPNLWANRDADPLVLAGAVAGMVGAADAWHDWAILANYPHLQPYTNTMYAVSWQDERYSQDLTELFEREFKKTHPNGRFSPEGQIRHSVGDFFHATPRELEMVGTFLANPAPIQPHSLLVLPTQTVRMRRFLINLYQRSPRDARNLVILNGDAIAFHSVYRDREVAWNIFDVPYSLVFFAHRLPTDHAAGFRWVKEERDERDVSFPQRTTTGTHDVLLYRDIIESLLYAAYDRGVMVPDAHALRDRLLETRWYHPPADRAAGDFPRVINSLVHALPGEHEKLFGRKGGRRRFTGEHIVWVRPNFTGDRVDLTSRITIWSRQPEKTGGAWRLVDSHDAAYNLN